MTLKKIISFGFKYEGEPPSPAGVLVVDIRQMFRNPYHDRKLRYKRGTDQEVQDDVMKTPNFQAKYDYLKEEVTTPGVEEAWIGCTGGRHRSVFLAERLGKELGVLVEHRDIDRS
jgi:UPF0042 nucleotide-binding protein